MPEEGWAEPVKERARESFRAFMEEEIQPLEQAGSRLLSDSGKEQLKNGYTKSQWEVGRANKIKYPEQIVLGRLEEK